tara:strand:+ start:352 stop:576 length:225 start_codon:yes stop_codon:yes gene_type:complete
MKKLKLSEIENIIRFIYEDYIDGVGCDINDEDDNELGYKDENELIEDFKLYVEVYKDYGKENWKDIKEGNINGW